MEAIQIKKYRRKIALEKISEIRESAHMYRVAELSYRFSRSLGLFDEVMKNIYSAAILHDIGKRLLDSALLTKPGPLTAQQKAIMNTHSELGARLGAEMNLTKQSIKYILEHHENYDGTGYPKGLKGENISLGGRIIKICDVFDALSSNRAYRQAYALSKVMEIMEKERPTFDPELYMLFKELVVVEN